MNTSLCQSLIQIIQDESSILEPQPTFMKPNLKKLVDIRAVLFDIYGTLFISGSGDISLPDPNNNKKAIRQALGRLNLGIDSDPPKDLFNMFKEIVQRHQRVRQSEEIEFPEVDIRGVWKDFLHELNIQHADEVIEALAVLYECLSNPIWPMPHLSETLVELKKRNKLLGLISNAQFYTPLLFPAFLGRRIEELGFLSEINFFSYELLEAKPSIVAYKKAAFALKEGYKITPEEVLYVGNDKLKDMFPAKIVGFKTAFFAGDKRSVRLRKEHVLCNNLVSDLIITDLTQVITCITPDA